MMCGKIVYTDCLDPIKGLSVLPDKSIDLAFTDPPFNVAFVGKESYEGKRTNLYYADAKRDYKSWCAEWFSQLIRVCNTVMIHCGKVNINMWYDIEYPYDIIYGHAVNAQPSPGKASWMTALHPVLCYGKFGKKRLSTDIISFKIKPIKGLIHPCPLSLEFITKVMKQFKPESVIDPFSGSGATGHVCELLGIKWLGYEINQEYKCDMSLRLKSVRSQADITTFFNTAR